MKQSMALMPRHTVAFTAPTARKAPTALATHKGYAALQGKAQRLHKKLLEYKDAAKDNVADLARPVAGLAGAAAAGAIRGSSFVAGADGQILERRLGGLIPYDLVFSTALTIAGCFADPDKAGRLATHAGMGGLAFRVGLATSEGVGQWRLGAAWRAPGENPDDEIVMVNDDEADNAG